MKTILFLVASLASLTISGSSVGTPYQRLNLIDDRFLRGVDMITFNRANFERSLFDLSNSFKQCLLEKGIKKSSFVSCVGGDYSKLGHNFRKTMNYIEIVLKKDFNADLSPICHGQNMIACDSLSEDLRDALESKKNPLPKMKRKSRKLELTPENKAQLNKALDKLQANYKDLKYCRKLMLVQRHSAVRKLIDYIKGLGIKTQYTYDFNPYELKQPLLKKLNRQLMQKDYNLMKQKLEEIGKKSNVL